LNYDQPGMISIRNKQAGAESGTANGVNFEKPFIRQKSGLLHFSQKIDYGFFLLVELAGNKSGAPVSLRKIAEDNRMSFFFMQKVALDLRRAGLINADRGKNGGYILAKEPAQITMRTVLEAIDGPVAIMHCLSHTAGVPPCIRESWCNVRPGLNFINQTIIDSLTKTTLADFLTNYGNTRN